jgi:hypothetical protein
MSNLAPWPEIAKPRKDIADGSFDESLFAADLGLVDRGRGPADYLDPITFCDLGPGRIDAKVGDRVSRRQSTTGSTRSSVA